MSWRSFAITSLVFLSIGFLIGNHSTKIFKNPSPTPDSLDVLTQKYPLLNKSMLIDQSTDTLIRFDPLKQDLTNLVSPWGTTFAFYFEYLPTGVSIGIHRDMTFLPHSLTKVPMAMAYYLGQEKDGLEYNPTVALTQSELDPRYGDLWRKGVGYQISLNDAVVLSLTQSDDTAAHVLDNYVRLQDYKDVYNGLDLSFPKDADEVEFSAAEYSSVLKSLYFASILNNDDSEHILDLLSQSTFNDQLRAGVPPNIKIAHKFGVFNDQTYQDCGIVYVPNRPYMLCMFSSSSGDEANQRMKSVSAMVYNYIANASN